MQKLRPKKWWDVRAWFLLWKINRDVTSKEFLMKCMKKLSEDKDFMAKQMSDLAARSPEGA